MVLPGAYPKTKPGFRRGAHCFCQTCPNVMPCLVRRHIPSMSLPFLLALSTVLHAYIGVRILPSLPGALPAAALTLLLVLSVLLVPMGMFARRLTRPPVADTLAAIGLLFMGLFSSLL